jgi:hypothetical protein
VLLLRVLRHIISLPFYELCKLATHGSKGVTDYDIEDSDVLFIAASSYDAMAKGNTNLDTHAKRIA